MSLKRPESFKDVLGHERIKKYILERVLRGTLPPYIMFYSEEGLGKTTLIKLTALALSCRAQSKPCGQCDMCREIITKVIRQNKDTDNVKTFKMSVDGSLDAVKDVLASLNTAFLAEGVPKIIILEECHGMENKVQDALLSDLEYLPDNVYVMMATTNISKINKALLSRFFIMNLNRLSRDEMVALLKAEARRLNIDVQGGNVGYELIAEWAENKPRRALNVLIGAGRDSRLTIDEIKDHIGFVDISEVAPILHSLSDNGSLTVGMNRIFNLQMGQSTHNSLITVVTEAVKLSRGEHTFKLSMEDYSAIKESVRSVDPNRLIRFLYDICAVQTLTTPYLIAAYLRAHPQGVRVENSMPEEVRQDEARFRQDHAPERTVEERPGVQRPTMGNLLKRSTIVE